ncbi:MAG: hypothetical protein ABSC65_30730, partial [Acidobacteriaceae bacterium]
MRKLVCLLPFLAVALSTAIAQSNVKTTGTSTGVDQDVLAKIPQRMKSFIDRQTVDGAVTLVAHGSDIVV